SSQTINKRTGRVQTPAFSKTGGMEWGTPLSLRICSDTTSSARNMGAGNAPGLEIFAFQSFRGRFISSGPMGGGSCRTDGVGYVRSWDWCGVAGRISGDVFPGRTYPEYVSRL